MKDKIYIEVNQLLNDILKTDRVYEKKAPLLGEGCIMDSITVVSFIALCNERYNINILENDINLDCLDSVESYVEYICELISKDKT